MSEIDDRLIIAIDTPSISRAKLIIDATHSVCQNYKFGLTFFERNRIEDVAVLADQFGFQAMIDKKYHDVPSQVADSIAELALNKFVRYATIHISGGREMLTQAVLATTAINVVGRDDPLKLLGITALTSLDDNDLQEIISPYPLFNNGKVAEFTVKDWVARLDVLATETHLPGRVCSVHELADMKQRQLQMDVIEKILVVPGITINGNNPGQKRTGRPSDAIAAGAHHIVVGRYITQKGVLDMQEAANEILADMNAENTEE
jgi:orotidine-5'-phosphate decarboxylase